MPPRIPAIARPGFDATHRFVVPPELHAELGAGATSGASDASAWRAANPGASGTDFDRYVRSALGAPPDAAGQQRDLERSRAAVATRTHESTEATGWLSRFGPNRVWWDYMNDWSKTVSPDQAKVGAALLTDALERSGRLSDQIKESTRRPRPFLVDPQLKPLHSWPGAAENFSFPSGHATQAWSGATVLAQLWPERRAEFESIAAKVSYARVHDAMHFSSDVVAGARLGALAATWSIVAAPGAASSSRAGSASASASALAPASPALPAASVRAAA